MAGRIRKSLNEPGEARFTEGGREGLDLVDVKAGGAGQGVCEPWWQGLGHIPSVAQTESCEVPRAGFALPGHLSIALDAAAESESAAGAFNAVPGHESGGGGEDLAHASVSAQGQRR